MGTHGLTKNMLFANLFFFGAYHLSNGPSKQRIQSWFVMAPNSYYTPLLLTHFAHTNPVPLAFNCYILSTLGASLLKTRGCAGFMLVAGVSAAGSALFAAADMRHDSTKSYTGGLGMSAGLVTYAAFRHPETLRVLCRLSPLTLVGLSVAYGLYCEDKSVIGGVSAGYLAFLMAL